jgi:hypothetical protein
VLWLAIGHLVDLELSPAWALVSVFPLVTTTTHQFLVKSGIVILLFTRARRALYVSTHAALEQRATT